MTFATKGDFAGGLDCYGNGDVEFTGADPDWFFHISATR
jgi:hypothetical protein